MNAIEREERRRAEVAAEVRKKAIEMGLIGRQEVLAEVFARAGQRRVYAFDERGVTVEVKRSARNLLDKKTREVTRPKGTIVCPPTMKYICVEGDPEWQRLPGHKTYSQLADEHRDMVRKKREAARASGQLSFIGTRTGKRHRARSANDH